MAISDDIRQNLARRCKSKRTRTSEFREEAPTQWQPRTLRDPRSPNSPFTDEGAWEFVATALEAGVDVEVVELRQPPGKRGYTMTLNGYQAQKIYVKLQLGPSKVIGRSFHESVSNGDR